MVIPTCQCCINIHNNVTQMLNEMTDIHGNKIEARKTCKQTN